MTRNEEFKSSALFHGTIHPFAIGDVVTPAGDSGADSGYAWATSDKSEAEDYARLAQDTEWSNRMKRGEVLDYAKHKEEYPQRVYEVQGLGDEKAPEVTRGQEGTVQSRKGFKVVKQIK